MNTHSPIEAQRRGNAQIPLLDLDLLKTILAIAETGNFSTAAEVVHRTPSAVSMQVKRIEELLQRQIFIRAARTVTLNEDGEMLVAHARRVLALNREIISKFIAPDVSGVVRLGATDHVTEQILPSVLCRFAETHPGVKVDVTVENTDSMVQKFRTGQLDIVMVSCDGYNFLGLEIEVLYREALVWAGLKGGIACERTPLPISVWEEGCIWRKVALAALEEHEMDYRITFKSAHISGQRAGILADLAVAPLPASTCDDRIIALGPECGLPDLSNYAVGMLVNKDASPPVQAVADQLRANYSTSA